MAQRETTQVQGTVEQVNQHGPKVNGKWFSYSKYHSVTAPKKGDRVSMQVEGDKFIVSLDIAGAPAPQPAQAPTAPSALAPAPREHHPKSEVFSPDSEEPDQRTAVRIAAVNAAFRFQGSGYSKYEDPFALAAEIECWISRA